MKKYIGILAMCALVNVAMASVIETFDTGSANWNYGYGTGFALGTTTWNAAGGNPGGHISGTSANLYAIWTYDTAAYGDITGLTMTIDTKVSDAEVGTAQFYVGRAGTYYIDGTWSIGADTAWTTHSVLLEASHFTPWSGATLSFADVLAAPDDIGIFFGGSVAAGAGEVLVDNFGVIPEPASLSLIGIIAGGIYFTRRFFPA
jgi:hypothetical protein